MWFTGRKWICFILFFGLSTTLIAQSISDSLSKKIDGLFFRWNLPNSPGCAIGIVRNDTLIYAKGYGMANLEYNIPITSETIFHTASVSKQFAAYSIVLLAKQGKLKLDDDIHQYLSWFPDLKEKITIRHLLNHTSGIRDQWQLLAISGTRLDDVITQDHIIKVLSRQQALNFKPGEQYSYSNSGFTMLAEIVKSVTGQTLRKFTDSAIFKPLGMSGTNFHDDYTEIVKNRAYSYGRSGNGFRNNILSYSNAGATSLFTNVNDMAKWISNLYYPKVGTAMEIKQLTQKGILNSGKELTYALGISVNQYKGWKQYSHSGGDAGYRTFITAFPDLKMGFIVFSNLGDFNPVGKTYELVDLFIRDTVLKATMGSRAIDTSMAEISNASFTNTFPGHYLSDAGVQFNFTTYNNRIYWERSGRSDLLVKTEKDTFLVAQSPEIKFVFRTTAANDTILNQFWPDGERLLLKFTPLNNLSENQLKEYTGTYYSQELDVKYGIELKGQDLMLTNNKYEDAKMRMVGKNDFFTNYWWMNHLKIIRDKKNKITGFEVNDTRIQHLKFIKTE